MDNIHIDTGEIRLSVNGDESRVIRFNPSDQLFAEKFYNVLGEIESKSIEYQRQAEALGVDAANDEHGIPLNTPARLALLRSVCEYNRSLIDDVFGEGTSQVAFGDTLSPGVFKQFFDGIAPYFQKARAAKIAPYLNSQKPARGTGRKTRKRK